MTPSHPAEPAKPSAGGRRKRKAEGWEGVRVFTVGHSTRAFEELLELLGAFGVTRLVDIRTMPRSRTNPQFNVETLRSALPAASIGYVHVPELGGLRRPHKDSVNTGWRNTSFRGFADYMQTPEFEVGLQKLRDLATGEPIAIMCAEAVPWRCHRSLVADALTARGAHVQHIMSLGHANPHKMTPFAHVEGTRVTYPGDGS